MWFSVGVISMSIGKPLEIHQRDQRIAALEHRTLHQIADIQMIHLTAERAEGAAEGVCGVNDEGAKNRRLC
jgi:hypothetical protein